MEVEIKKSPIPAKKYVSIFYKDGKKIKTTHFGSSSNKDYTIYYKEDGKAKAEERKRLYIGRHRKRENWKDPQSAGALSKYILWSRPTVAEGISYYLKSFKLKKKT